MYYRFKSKINALGVLGLFAMAFFAISSASFAYAKTV